MSTIHHAPQIIKILRIDASIVTNWDINAHKHLHDDHYCFLPNNKSKWQNNHHLCLTCLSGMAPAAGPIDLSNNTLIAEPICTPRLYRVWSHQPKINIKKQYVFSFTNDVPALSCQFLSTILSVCVEWLCFCYLVSKNRIPIIQYQTLIKREKSMISINPLYPPFVIS